MGTDSGNQVVKLCVKGTQAEFQGRKDQACALYRQAWVIATDDYEACIAAHYVARCQSSPDETFHWNHVALERADATHDARVKDFYPSLYLNLGRSYEMLGDQENAAKYYTLADRLGLPHQMD